LVSTAIMHQCGWFLFLLSPSLSEELTRKHHKKHHKHHHGHHAHKNVSEPIDGHHVSWKVSNHSNVVKIPPTPEEYAAVDAINAHNAANSAGEAAKVATKVAAHSIDINMHAQSALNKAQNVLKEARAGAGGLAVDQKELLKRAEINLAHATDSVTYNVGSVTYSKVGSSLHADSATERAQLEDRLSKLQQQLDRKHQIDVKHQPVEVLRSENELAAMELEIRGLQADLDEQLEKDTAMRRDAEVQATQQELTELEAMVKEVEVAEATHQVKVSEHDELKIELEKLRETIQQMQGKTVQDTGTLVYEVPAKRQLPLRTVETVDDSVAPAASMSSGTDQSQEGIAVDSPPEEDTDSTPVAEKGIDIDTAMPYGELEPFGREDTAQELTEDSVRESDEMVDQLERAEVAEEKRAVFRALTRLRGAAITSFDGIARSQTGNIDEYNKLHKWRRTHPLHHLADEESDISKWAFPDNADF